jgi:hypothetical protein
MDEENYTMRLMGPMVFSKSVIPGNMADSPFSIAVTTEGRRYICEPSQPRLGPFDSGLIMMEQPKGYVYILFDTNNLEAAIQDNLEHPKPESDNAFAIPPLPSDLKKAEEDIGSVIGKEPAVFCAQSVEELAEKTGLDKETLCTTVEDYNRYCEEGFDASCFKAKEYLVPFTKAPFYAVQAKLGTDGAFGGVTVNENMQAYRKDGSLIDGLYVTGDFASGRFLNMAGVKVQVLNDMSWALASGFLAGSDVCKYLEEEEK